MDINPDGAGRHTPLGPDDFELYTLGDPRTPTDEETERDG